MGLTKGDCNSKTRGGNMVVEDETITSNCHVEEIERFSRANIKSYIAAREGGGTPWWKSIESLSGQVANEYQGRVLYELIQNASDAHSRAGAAAGVRICLDRSEGGHGAAYVVNAGRPFARDNFRAINSIAQSSKPPGQGIGNKGLGFRSVLTVCDWPEIYSANWEPSVGAGLNGFCFGFARPADLASLCGGDSVLARDVERDIHPMLLPTPRWPVPEPVCRFADAQTATIVRLPLRNEQAALAIERQIKEL
jgi:hypothetical protein